MAFISEFTNEIYDHSNAAFNDQGDSTKVFLGVLVTLLPKVRNFKKQKRSKSKHFLVDC